MLRSLLLAAVGLLSPAVAGAQSVEEFYRGKTITVIIGFAAGRFQRFLRSRGRAQHGQAHPRQSDGGAAQHAGRRQPHCRQPHLQRGGEGRHHARPDRADRAAGGTARRVERPLQGGAVQLHRTDGGDTERDLHGGIVAGEDHPGRDGARGEPGRDRAKLDGFDLSDPAQPRGRHQIQAGHGLQGLAGGDAGHGPRRGRRPHDHLGRR